MSQKVVTIFGATGAQGGSVIKTLLADSNVKKQFRLRGVTRDTSKASAKALEVQGVETVAANLDDADSIRKAVEGSYAVYGVTNYWDSMDQEKEEKQGRTIVDASKQAGVQHLIFSVLKNVKKLSHGEFPNVYHFDAKARIADYIKETGIPHTNFLPGFYMSNIPSSVFPGKDGLIYTAPFSENTPLPLFAAETDTGLFIKAILLNREATLGKDVLGATAYVTPTELVHQFEEGTGKSLQFVQASEEAFKGALKSKGMPDFAVTEFYENMMFMEPYGYYGKESLDWSLSLLDEKPTTFAEFAKAQKQWHA